MNRETATRKSLLARLVDLDDQEAWNEFVDRYGPKILIWCRRFSLQDSDAADVTQEVLSKLVLAMRDFDYDSTKGSFRGWLKTVTSNAVRDWARSAHRTKKSTDDFDAVMQELTDPKSIEQLSQVIEEGHQAEILREAQSRVSLRVKPNTWRAYEETAVKQRKAPEVATELNMPVSEVYVAKSRVLKLLRETVTKLEGTGED